MFVPLLEVPRGPSSEGLSTTTAAASNAPGTSSTGLSEILLVLNKYNEAGQLIDRKLHSTVAAGTDAKQSVDYRYNIRGRMTSINNSELASNTTNGDTNDLFGMELAYQSDKRRQESKKISKLPLHSPIHPQYAGKINQRNIVSEDASNFSGTHSRSSQDGKNNRGKIRRHPFF